MKYRDACTCARPRLTGRKYMGLVACFCGGLVVNRLDLGRLRRSFESEKPKSERIRITGGLPPKSWEGAA